MARDVTALEDINESGVPLRPNGHHLGALMLPSYMHVMTDGPEDMAAIPVRALGILAALGFSTASILSPAPSPTHGATSARQAAAIQSSTALDVSAIRFVVAQAMIAKDSLFVASSPTPGVPISAADLQAAQTQAGTVLGQVYQADSPLLPSWLNLVRRGLQSQSSGQSRVVGGGIRDVAFQSISITGATAIAHLTFTNYAEFALRNPDGTVDHVSPSNKMIETVALANTALGWRVTDDKFSFAPGSEP